MCVSVLLGVTGHGVRTQLALLAGGEARGQPRPHHLACVNAAPTPTGREDPASVYGGFLFPYLATRTSNILLEKNVASFPGIMFYQMAYPSPSGPSTSQLFFHLVT